MTLHLNGDQIQVWWTDLDSEAACRAEPTLSQARRAPNFNLISQLFSSIDPAKVLENNCQQRAWAKQLIPGRFLCIVTAWLRGLWGLCPS
jgi:hypothetical protein